MPLPAYKPFLDAMQANLTAEQLKNPLIGPCAHGYCCIEPSRAQLRFLQGWLSGLAAGGAIDWDTRDVLDEILDRVTPEL